jgi:hypothetical protein
VFAGVQREVALGSALLWAAHNSGRVRHCVGGLANSPKKVLCKFISNTHHACRIFMINIAQGCAILYLWEAQNTGGYCNS